MKWRFLLLASLALLGCASTPHPLLSCTSASPLALAQRPTLRQTLTRSGANDFHIVNEELRPGGAWRRLDEYRYHRLEPPAGP